MTNKTALQLLPLIQPSQAQKHVTVNAAMTVLDVLVQTTAISRLLTAPPVGAVAGDSYIVASGATGDWLGQEEAVAVYTGTFWDFYLPKTGWRVWLEGEETEAVYDGGSWTTSADRPIRVAALGISATADDVNRLTVSAAATLLTNAGAGHQLKINKAHTGDTASLLFQNNFSGRAEMGNVGNDNFVLKVSPDGTTFLTGLTIEAATGRVIASHGVNILPGSADPASPQDGDIWYNSTSGRLRARQGGVSLDLCHVASAQISDSTAAGRTLLTAADAAAQRTALGVEAAANKGAANGYAGLDASGKVPAGQLPSYVDDVLEFANLAGLPGTGETGKIYVTLDTNKTWRWSGSAYLEISNTAPAWADVTGRPTSLSGYGITDAVDLAGSQTISGAKTFTGSVSFTGPHVIVDSGLTLQDDGDATKRANFQLSGLSTGATRSFGLPDASGSVVIDATPVTTIGNVTSSPVTVNLAAGAVTSGLTKAINIGTAGLAGSTTNIALGSGVSGALGALTIASPTVSFASSVTSITMPDAALTLQSAADASKQVKFDLSALSSGTTRSLALPNASGTLALNTGFGALVAGLVPASGGGSTNFLRADGTWAAPPGGSASSAYSLLTGVPAAIDALDALSPSADTIAYFTASASAALSTLTSYGRSLMDDADANTARTTLERQDFATRAAFVTWATGRTPTVGLVMRADGRAYRYIGSGTAISDLPGWVPFGIATALHWGADITGATSAITAVGAMIDFVNSIGGGVALMPAGTYLWAGSLVRQGLNKVCLEGEGNVTKILRSGNRTAPIFRFWGGANNRIRKLFIECAGYSGRGIHLQDQYSGIEDCECNNCPDRPFGLQGGGNATYGLDSGGRTSDDSGFTGATIFPIGCYIENCRTNRSGNTAFSQKQMPHSRIQRCTAQNSYSEGITVDRCDYSVVMSNTLLNISLIDTNQFPDLDAGTGFLSAGGGGVGGIGIDGSNAARVVKNTIIGVQSNTATRNNRSRAAINFVNNIQAASGCQIEGNYIADAKAGVWLKGTGSGAAGGNFRHVIDANVFENMGTAAGSGIAQYGAVWIDAGCTDNVVAHNTQIGGTPLITGGAGNTVMGVDLTSDQSVAGIKSFAAPVQLAVQSSDPAVAAAGNLRLYSKKVAEAAIPAFRGPNGLARAVQSALWDTQVHTMTPAFSTATLAYVGSGGFASYGTVAAASFAVTNHFTRSRRNVVVSATTAGSMAGYRGYAVLATSDGAGLGGFLFNTRFGIADAATVSGAQMFVGLSTSGIMSPATEPSTLTSSVGVGHGAADTNLKIYYGGSTAQTPIDLGANFPVNTLSTDSYALTLHAPSDASGTVHYQVERLNTGHVATGTLSGSAAVLPNSTSILVPQLWRGNNATALAVTFAFMQLYIETGK